MAHEASNCLDIWDRGDPSCHNDGDTGADFYDAGREGSDFLLEAWSFPYADLSKIFERMGMT